MENPKPLWMGFAGAEEGLADDQVWPTHGQEAVVSGEQSDWDGGVHVLRAEGGGRWVCATCGWGGVA